MDVNNIDFILIYRKYLTRSTMDYLSLAWSWKGSSLDDEDD